MTIDWTAFTPWSAVIGGGVIGAALIVAPPVAAMDPCGVLEPILFSPANPGTADTINWWSPIFSQVHLDPVPIYMVKTTLGINNQISLDVRATSDPATLPGYDIVGPYPYYGHFGPLAAGDYSVGAVLYGTCVAALSSLTVSTQPAATATAPVVEFYNATLDQYHSTQNAAEIHDLDTGVHPGWVRTGGSFMAYVPGQDDNRGVIVQRWYGKPEAGLNSHFLTWLPPEEDALSYGFLAGAWIFESGATFVIPAPYATTGACPGGTVPVYRLWNNRPDSGHRYTADKATQQQMMNAGSVAEGFGPDSVFMCAVAPVVP